MSHKIFILNYGFNDIISEYFNQLKNEESDVIHINPK